jgi:hypothetical protein
LLDNEAGRYQPEPGDTFELISATEPLVGEFDNVSDGARLNTFGGEGSSEPLEAATACERPYPPTATPFAQAHT